jgi:Zn-dependent protease
VLGHEVAHIFVANTLGYKSKYIIITSIGGLSLIDLKDADYIEKILIALVGPIFNIIIGLFFLLINSFLIHLNLGSNDIVIIMMMVNLFLGFFNLLPMYPADGCTIFESLIMTLNPHNLQANLFLVKTTSLLTGLVMVCMGLYLLMNYHHYYMYVI